MLGDLHGRTALVTGGASGLGRGIVLELAGCKADVAVTDLNLEGASRVATEVTGLGSKARAFHVDVTDRASVQRMVEEVQTAFGQIDILVNSAGVVGARGYEETATSREDDWDITYQVNVKGTVLVSEAVAEQMKARRYGKIVNIASHAGRHGGPGGGAYGASKAAVIHLTQSFALDLAPYDINVNCICPGTIWTPMWDRIARRMKRNDPSKKDMTPRQIFDEVIQERCPLKREQTPGDIGKMAAFLASDDALNITGQAINVNGGSRMN
jgi:meso-butanediol dehydrogenase/(S,S)-butanediol dehydrogenase/diacetyl reductase